MIEHALAPNGPHRKRLSEKDVRVISGAQPHDHKWLFRSFEASETRQELKDFYDKAKTDHFFEGDHDIPLNDTHCETKVNVFKYSESDQHEKTKVFSWMTDLPLM